MPLVASAEYFLEEDRGVRFIAGNIPQEIVLGDNLPKDVIAAGVLLDSLDATTSITASRFIQLSLGPAAQASSDQRLAYPIVYADSSDSLTNPALDDVRAVARAGLEFLETEFGVRRRVWPIVRVGRSGTRHPGLEANHTDPADLGIDADVASDPTWMLLYLAKFWWGVGCRVRGVKAVLLLASFGVAAAIRWSMARGAADPSPAIAERWRARCRNSDADSLIQAQLELGRIIAHVLDKPEGRSALQQFLLQSWGTVLDAETLLVEVDRWARM
ncbi:MAG TPA: hypothetical protein VFK13_11190 [Gemmatimonadaceae bacterium]|nr:hypothetical protein [Gemmatimonadaceae bacterium]